MVAIALADFVILLYDFGDELFFHFYLDLKNKENFRRSLFPPHFSKITDSGWEI